MSNNNPYNPVIVGGFVAALVIGAFAIGYSVSQEPAGPAEKMGQKLDKAAQDLKQGIDEVAPKKEGDGG